MLKKNKRKIVSLAAVIGLLVFLHISGILRPAENMVTAALNPVMGKVYFLGSELRRTYDRQASRADLSKEISSLEERIKSLTEDNARLKLAEDENRSLRNYLGFLRKSEFKYIMANIISRGSFPDISGRAETITIDKGARDGIYEGLGAVDSGGGIIGKISGVKENVSEIYLTNSAKCKLAATILGQDKTSGITEGELGLTIGMGYIPQDAEIKTDDIVVTSGLERSIPRGLVIGRVMEVKSDSNELWKAATIEPIVDPDDLAIVSVLLPEE